MMGTWMLYAIGVGAALGVAALLGERVLYLLGLPRRGGWAITIAASVLLPVVLPVWSGVATHPDAVPLGFGEPMPVGGFAPLGGEVAASLEAGRGWGAPMIDQALGWGWSAASTICLLGLLISFVSLARMRRGWRAARVADTPVFVSRSSGPAVVGCFRTCIVLPEWVLDWEAGRQRMIVEHEREHARARDPLLMMGAWLALVLTPWNLPLWWQVHRLRLAVEMDCDRRVLRRMGDVHGYGVLLLEVSGRARNRWVPAAAFSESASFLERRIRGMTAVRSRYWVAHVVAMALLIAALPLTVVAVQPAESPFTGRMAGWLTGAIEEDRIGGGETGWERIGYSAHDVDPVSESPVTTPDRAAGPPPQDTSRIYDVSEVSRYPRLSNASTVAAEMQRLYPRMLRDAGIQGTVIVEFVIERDGSVNPAMVQVIETPHDALGSATRQALEAFRFTPAQVDGVDVRSRTRMPITWRPDDGPAPRPMPPGAVPVRPDSAASVGTLPMPAYQAGPQRVAPVIATSFAIDGQALRQGQNAATAYAVPTRQTDTIPHEIGTLSRPPRLANAPEVRAAMDQLYPPELQAAGIGGTVIMQFVIGADGRVDARTIEVISSAHAGLDEPTLLVVQRMRFNPGQYEGRDARVLTQMPITWQPQNTTPTGPPGAAPGEAASAPAIRSLPLLTITREAR